MVVVVLVVMGVFFFGVGLIIGMGFVVVDCVGVGDGCCVGVVVYLFVIRVVLNWLV